MTCTPARDPFFDMGVVRMGPKLDCATTVYVYSSFGRGCVERRKKNVDKAVFSTEGGRFCTVSHIRK